MTVTIKMFGASSLAMAHLLVLLWTCFFFVPYVYADPSGLYTHNVSQNSDLVSILNSKPQSHDVIFIEAVQLLESMKSTPSCNRIAATKLVTSCQSIGRNADNIGSKDYMTLERIRSLYAARLAICELDGAGVSIPTPCATVYVLPSQKKSRFGFSTKYESKNPIEYEFPPQALGSCLKTLESRPQWWTSYSNSRQNAVVICQAARIENEKEELLDLHKSIVQATFKLNHGLKEALQTASAESAAHGAFINTVNAMREKLSYELDETESRVKTVLGGIVHDIELSIGSALNSAASALGRLRTGTGALEKDVQNVSDEVYSLQGLLQTVHAETLERNAQFTQAHRQDTLAQNDLATSLRSSLETLLQGDMARLFQNVGTFDALLEWLTERMSLVLQQEAEVSERLRSFELTLQNSEMKAGNLLDAQKLQHEAITAHSQAHDNLQTNMHISKALVDEATAAAANLQTMINESASKYRDSFFSSGPIGPYFPWTVCVLLFCMLSAQNLKYALTLLLIGIFHLIVTRVYF